MLAPQTIRAALPRVGSGRPRLVALGDLVLDIVVTADVEIATGTDVGGAISFRTGGSAANTARAFAALGGRATFVGAVGTDALGRRLVASLRTGGVTTHVARAARPTARVVVIIGLGARGERSFITQRGAADQLRPADLRATWFSRTGALHLPAYSLLREPLASAALTAAAWARAGGALVSVDLASARPLADAGRRRVQGLLADVAPDVLFGNVEEARVVAGGHAERSLLALAPTVVIKEGAEGGRVLWRAEAGDPASDVLQQTVATRRIDTADTTGAGDAFDAGFLHALLSEPDTAPGDGPRRAAGLRRAALAGHRAAAALLSGPRPELTL